VQCRERQAKFQCGQVISDNAKYHLRRRAKQWFIRRWS
jgi:hypothetical protein